MELINGRYEGRLSDGRLLCILPDVFEMNQDIFSFSDSGSYSPDEWLFSIDEEDCWIVGE